MPSNILWDQLVDLFLIHCEVCLNLCLACGVELIVSVTCGSGFGRVGLMRKDLMA